MKQTLRYLSFLFLFGGPLYAQPDHYNFNTLGQSNSNPWNLPAGKRVQILYMPGAFAQPTSAPTGFINTLSFMINQNLGPWTYSDLTIQLGQTSSTGLPTTGFYAGAMDTVYYRPSVSLTGTSGQWMNIALDSSFYYDPALSLVLEISHCGAPGAANFSACFTPVGNVTRCWSAGGCPFVYSTWSNQVYHMGITMGSIGTGVDEIVNQSIHITDQFGQVLATISLPVHGKYNVAVYDLLGSIVYGKADFTVKNQSVVVIENNNLKSGVYMVTVFSQDIKVTHKVFIKSGY